MTVSHYAKFWVMVVITVAVAVQSAITDGVLTNTEIVNIVLVALGALGVYVVPNKPTV